MHVLALAHYGNTGPRFSQDDSIGKAGTLAELHYKEQKVAVADEALYKALAEVHYDNKSGGGNTTCGRSLANVHYEWNYHEGKICLNNFLLSLGLGSPIKLPKEKELRMFLGKFSI